MITKARNVTRPILAIVLAFLMCFGQGISAWATGDMFDENQEARVRMLEIEKTAAFLYDPQPMTAVEVQATINIYNEAYEKAMAESGFLAALAVSRPHWQYEVASELMPKAYHCELVDWDEAFGMEYYTFFSNPAPMAYGAGYVTEPPRGHATNVTNYFNIISGFVDPQYPHVAVITSDSSNQYGAMWAKEKLDLTMPFSTEMYLHLGHEEGKYGSVADGMTLTFHNDPKELAAIGGLGEGLGVYKGRKSTGGINTVADGTYLRNSLVIEFDTYRNLISQGAFVGDPTTSGFSAHCALVVPRADIIYESDHKNTFFFNPSQDWVKFEANWQPDGLGGGVLKYSFNGISRECIITNTTSFFGSNKVYWGFTGTTGDLSSLQAAALTKLPTQELITEKSVENAKGENVDGGVSRTGSILSYTIKATATKTIEGIGPIVLTDSLSPHTEYTGGDVTVITSDGQSFLVTPSFNNSILSVDTGHILGNIGDWLTISFNVQVKESSEGNIAYNTAVVDAAKLTESNYSNTTEVTIIEAAPIPVKRVSSETGRNDAAVKVNDRLVYEIGYVNYEATLATVTIVDKLPNGVSFVSADNGGVYDSATHTVTWTLSNISSGTSGTVSVTVDVNEKAVVKIENEATVQVGNNEPTVSNKVENPVTPEQKANVNYNANGGSGKYTDENLTLMTKYIILSSNDVEISRNGYTFKNWNTASDGTGMAYSKNDSIIITENVTLYAQWIPNNNQIIDTKNHFAYIIGYPDGSVRPESNITRAEIATIFFRMITKETRADMWSKINNYSDVELGTWYNNAISTLSNGNILTGYPDGTFAPNATITRAELAAIAIRSSAKILSADSSKIMFSDISDHWAENSIQLAAQLGYVIGYEDGTFRPDEPITRAEVATLLNRVLNRVVNSENDMLENMVIWPDNKPDKWYYIDIQEATNSHYYKHGGENEIWTDLRGVPNWSILQEINAKPEDISY